MHLIPAFWIGGMATHGLLLGGFAGVLLFCWTYRESLLRITDAHAMPAAFILGVGRIGDFIDGQIVGSVTNVWWAVKFPDAEGFRHPVVLYDGIRNLLIIPVLWCVRTKHPPSGVLTGVFVFLYAVLRTFVDVYREYPTTLLGLATGQSLNIFMALFGAALLIVRLRASRSGLEGTREKAADAVGVKQYHPGLHWRRGLLAFLLLFSLVLPSDWTQDVPARYGKRHQGLRYSAIYPRIDAGATPR